MTYKKYLNCFPDLFLMLFEKKRAPPPLVKVPLLYYLSEREKLLDS